MTSIFKCFLFAFCLTALVACGGGDDSPPPTQEEPNPQTPEEALSLLSKEHRASFDVWTARVVKSCDPGQIFEPKVPSKEVSGVDYPALYRKNQETLVFNEGKSFAIAAGYRSFSGNRSEVVFNRKLSVNGQTYEVKSSSKQEGSKCEVFLFGQKVYQTTLSRQTFIKGYWAPGKEIHYPNSKPADFEVDIFSSQNLVMVKKHGISEALWRALEPEQETHNFLAKQLGIPVEQARELFVLRVGNSYDVATSFRLEDEISPYWFNHEDEALIGPTNAVEGLLSGGFEVPAFVRMKTPRSALGQYELSGLVPDRKPKKCRG